VDSHRNSNPWIEWEMKIGVMYITGRQDIKPTKRKCGPLSDELGKLLMLEAPPVVVVQTVQNVAGRPPRKTRGNSR
jgi:hypothetical protein